MKNHFSNRIVLGVSVLLTSLVISGCNTYKATPELNVYHPNVYATYGEKVDRIKGFLCAKQEFKDNFGSGLTQEPKLSIVLNEGYSRYITGTLVSFNEERVSKSLPLGSLKMNSLYQQECGLNKKYPIVHGFVINIPESYPDRKGKEIRMAEYYDIVNQIKQNKYLDIRALIVPMVNTSIEGSAQDARMYFTDAQVKELFSDKE